MREDSPRWEQINPSPFEHERNGLRDLASYLPDREPFHVWANVEFVGTDGSINEVDALVLTPSGLYILELKHWQGQLVGNGTQWVRRAPNGRSFPEDNPYILANRKAKRLASLIKHYARQQGKADAAPFVGAAVFLHASNLQARLDDIGSQHVYGLDEHPSGGLNSLKNFLLDHPRNPRHLIDAARARQIVELVRGANIRASVADRKVGQLLIHPKPLAEGIGWQDFLAGHALDTSLVRRVRFYLTSRATAEELPAIKRGAEREFRLLQGIHHPGIASATDLVDHSFGPAVVFHHEQGWVRLDQWLSQKGATLTIAQRLQLVQDLAEILDYAHSRRLAHRSLHPQAIFVTDPDKPRPGLVIADWQTGGRLASTTRATSLGAVSDGAGLELFFDEDVRRYQAPEAGLRADVPGNQLDVFSLGAMAYAIFAGTAPAATPEELAAAVRDGGLNLSAVADGIPDSLITVIYDATRGRPGDRLPSVSQFLAGLERVWDELTAPEPKPVIDPRTARKGDLLDGDLTVLRRLGSGATATALLVKSAAGDELVLKVAKEERHSERLKSEARTVGKLKDWRVAALVDGPVTVGGHTALLLESAGPRTLAEELDSGRLALDLLERYGRDLHDIVDYLDGVGVWHRDLKPANLAARPRPRDSRMHLCVFDFSLSETPADQLSAGTTHYLDPFLGPPRRMRYDAAAERFAAAVTLYEMATGSLPRWSDDGANPAAVSDEVLLDPALFDPAIADRLVTFFQRALARDAARRFDTTEEMADAWRALFKDIPESPPAGTGSLAPLITRDSALDVAGLTARARSGLERLNIHTVGELLDHEPSAITRAKGIPDATRKEILAQARALRVQLPSEERPPPDEEQQARGVEALCATLLPARKGKERDTLEVLLGQAPTADQRYLAWPAQKDAAQATGQTQPQISIWLRKRAADWLKNTALSQVRDEVVALLDARGAVLSAEQLAEAVIAARGSYTAEPQRLPQAIGLVRAAVEAELSRGGDARLAIRRSRTSDTVLVGREQDDPTATTTAADLLEHAVRLGRRAAELSALDPLPSKQRAIGELRQLDAPDGMHTLNDLRLLQLAAAASNGVADVNALGQLYPVGMSAERALRLSAGTLLGTRLDPETVQERVRGRFPCAEPLPRRPALDALMETCTDFRWDTTQRHYAARSLPGSLTMTRTVTTHAPLLGPSAVADTDARLAAAFDRRAFLAVLVRRQRVAETRLDLLRRYDLVELDVTQVLLDELRGLGLDWSVIAAADTGRTEDADFRSLTELVQHNVVPVLRKAFDTDRPLLITEAAPLTRYGQLGLLAELADLSRSRPAARLLLVPARKPEPAELDNAQLPLTSPGNQSLWLPEAWLSGGTKSSAG